jgi:hypothetical protein
MSEPSQGAAASAPAVDATARFTSLLASGERVHLVRRRHWFTFIQAARWFLLLVAVGALIGLADVPAPNDGTFGFLSTILGWGFGIFLVIGLAGLGWYYLEWQRERYLVTTRRVIETGGVINKWSRDTSLSMITDMLVGHPWIGRIVGYGEIDLLTASEAGTNKIQFLPDADGFKKALPVAKYEHELDVGGARDAHDSAPAAAQPPRAEADRITGEEVDASITHLADLRDRGLITAAEFEEKKRELLDRL